MRGSKPSEDFPFDKNTIRIYRFYFLEVQDPVNIEAFSKAEAIAILDTQMAALGLKDKKIVNEKVFQPVSGVTIKFIEEIEYTWVGFDVTESGWMPMTEYIKNYGNGEDDQS